MAKTGRYDAAILGGVLGLVLTKPAIAEWFTDFFTDIIPSSWIVFGAWSIPIYGVIVGLIIGMITEKTR